MIFRITGIGLSALALTACASTGGSDGASSPDYAPVAGQPLTANARLILACVDQARATDRTEMIGDDGDSRLIRFTCQGAPAESLFNALAQRSAAIGSEWRMGAVVYRSTETIQHNLYGADLCRRDDAVLGGEDATYLCQINLNLGGFIKQ